MVSTLRPLWRVSTHIGAWVGVELCEERTLAYCGQAKLEERKSTSNMPDDVPRAGGSGRAGPDLEARVALLETAVLDTRSELKAIRGELADLKPIRLELAEIKGKISNMPTTATLLGLIVTILAAGFGMSLAVVRLASGH
jgi:hypothetical protein